MNEIDFVKYGKTFRWNRDVEVTEKIDGSNAQLVFRNKRLVAIGSRNRWITPDNDNHGFAAWAVANEAELEALLGDGHHFGEWWGQGIQRKYDLDHKRFTPFVLTSDGGSKQLSDCGVWSLPVLYRGPHVELPSVVDSLRHSGSTASPLFMNPEGVIVRHLASNHRYKITLENDDQPKGQ